LWLLLFVSTPVPNLTSSFELSDIYIHHLKK